MLFRRIARRDHVERDLGFCQLAIAALALIAVGLEAFVLTQPYFAEHVSIFSLKVEAYNWVTRLSIATIVSICLLLPPTICMGLSFPLASRLYVEDVKRLGSSIGTAYLLANIGSILGIVVAAAFLMPVMGTGGATKLVAGVNLALGLLILLYLKQWTGARILGALTATAVVAAMIAIVPPRIPFAGNMETDKSRLL